MLEQVSKYRGQYVIWEYSNIDKVKLDDIIKYEGRTFIVDKIILKKKAIIVTEI
jgi:hypothetical protein